MHSSCKWVLVIENNKYIIEAVWDYCVDIQWSTLPTIELIWNLTPMNVFVRYGRIDNDISIIIPDKFRLIDSMKKIVNDAAKYRCLKSIKYKNHVTKPKRPQQ